MVVLPPIHIALLRGINVGGKHKLPMRDLAALFEQAGCQDVRTYIQSGNVLFRAHRALAAKIPQLIAAAIALQAGMQIPVVTRTADELRAIIRRNPFLETHADLERLHVAFLADPPALLRLAQLDPHRSPPDTFQVHGREIYLHLPNGVARSKLTNAYFDSTLATVSTIRNWRTVLALLELAEQ